MKTPTQYKNLITDLGIDQIQNENITSAETQQHLSHLAEIYARIRDLEVNLNQDIHALRSQYQGKLASFGTNPRRKIQIGEEQRIEEEREMRLAPYEEVKNQIQAILVQLEEKRANLEKRITNP